MRTQGIDLTVDGIIPPQRVCGSHPNAASSLFAFFVIGFLSVACTGSGDEARDAPLAVRDSAGVRIITVGVNPEDVPRWELLEPPELVIGGHGEGGSPLFAGLAPQTPATWLSDGRILVADQRAGVVHLFDPAGRYLRSLGGKGEGPGEFRFLSRVAVGPGDSLYVYDPGLDRLSLFKAESGFVRFVRLSEEKGGLSRPLSVRILSPGRLVVHRIRGTSTADRSLDPAGRLYSSEGVLTLHDATGRLVVGPIPFAISYGGLYERGTFSMPFANDPFVAACDGRIVVSGGQDWRLRLLDEEGRTVREIRWPSRQEPITDAEVDTIREELRKRTSFGERPKLLETALDPELLPEHRPALEQVLCDAGGSLWAGRFEPGLSPYWPTRWDVLAPDGRPIGRLRLPPDTRLVAVAGDRVMVVARDAVDVEEVRIHRVGSTGDDNGFPP